MLLSQQSLGAFVQVSIYNCPSSHITMSIATIVVLSCQCVFPRETVSQQTSWYSGSHTSPLLLKQEKSLLFSFHAIFYLLKSVLVAFCLHPFSLSFIFNILFQVMSNSSFIHQSFSAAGVMMGCSYLPMPSQPLKIAFCTLVYNLVSALFSL